MFNGCFRNDDYSGGMLESRYQGDVGFWYKKLWRDFILLGAVIFPFIISVFLYASYKSLGFGLILLIFSVFSNRKLEKNNQAVS